MSKFDPYEHLKVSLNRDGSLTRYIKLPTSAPTGEAPQNPCHATLSKDVTLNADKKTWMRIYRPTRLPSNDNSVARLPIIFYFHPGGWIQMSVADTLIHESSNRISAEVPAILVAVEFRLAPESRLPAQYEDAVDAVLWVRNQFVDHKIGDQWIRDYGDFSRCYLYGVSCGANIAFNVALRLQEVETKPVKIAGVILNQPFFGSKQRTKSELKLATDPYFPLPVQDLLWELALPVGTDRDHRYSNPFMDKTMREKVKNLGRCLVIGFGGDPLVDRQQEFVQMLVLQGVPMEARFDDVGFHGIDMIDSRRATAILNFIKEFV
ncbi:Arylacetamide deacetylase [Handroanthus impetiginosus]|uniref:Arylacetamide deacetylase n=1 Tax=Handroanthus impetiginosus TaxID=429701 RepID=A0A2G9G5K5_9LAMI|nr:Arylacetamide deacetylase [Handroanthus impetiginosus]PIN06536.1 Arylacetamide deacetylase [Handroanthus impetiginosus]